MRKDSPMSRDSDEKRPRGLRMNQLCRLSGLPKSTILYYVEQGLLPKPEKTSPNMAYYHPDCVDRLAFIKEMQTRHRLPLASIKKLLAAREQGQEVEHLARLNLIIFGEDSGDSVGSREFCSRTGLEPDQLEELLRAGLILPLTPGRFDQRDLALGQVFARASKQGITCEDLIFYHRLGSEMVDMEMELRQRLTSHLPDSVDAEMTGRMVQSARAVREYVIDRIFQLRVAAHKSLKDPGLPKGRKGEKP